MCIDFASSVHGLTADEEPIFTLYGNKSTVQQS